jgi:hypothetical protein
MLFRCTSTSYWRSLWQIVDSVVVAVKLIVFNATVLANMAAILRSRAPTVVVRAHNVARNAVARDEDNSLVTIQVIDTGSVKSGKAKS